MEDTVLTFAASALMRLGVGEKLAKVLGPVVLAGLVVGLIFGAVSCIRSDAAKDERARQEAINTKARLEAEQRNAAAREKAEVRRQQDAQTIGDAQKGRDDAIRSTDPNQPPDPRTRLACERLRRAGTAPDRLPEPCRPRG